MPLPVQGDMGGSVRSARRGGGKAAAESRWGSNEGSGAAAKKKFTGGRQIVFVVGGVTYSEVRGAYESMKEGSKEVVVGGTSFITPADFLAGLEALK
jgi:syntaxin-binding protein 1